MFIYIFKHAKVNIECKHKQPLYLLYNNICHEHAHISNKNIHLDTQNSFLKLI